MTTTEIHFNVRLAKESYDDLFSHLSHLRPTGEDIAGMQGPVYCPSGDFLLRQYVVSDVQLVLGPMLLRGDFSHMPTAACNAMARVSPDFRRPAMFAELQQAVADPQANVVLLKAALELAAQTAAVPAKIDEDPNEPVFFRCLPQGTRLIRNSGHWFISFRFDALFRPHQAPGDRRVGLDLGWMPLTVAVTDRDEVHEFPSTDLRHLSDLWQQGALSAGAAGLLAQIEYSIGRDDCERVMRYLLANACAVHSERLGRETLNRVFVSLARRRAIYDHHNAWLAALLMVGRIPLSRTPAAWTSRRCSRCRQLGIRTGKAFACPACGAQEHADHNAARNVLLGGLGRAT